MRAHSAALLLLLGAFQCPALQAAKCSAEEIGYLEEVAPILRESHKAVYGSAAYVPLCGVPLTASTSARSTRAGLEADADAVRAILPPPGFEDLHRAIVTMVEWRQRHASAEAEHADFLVRHRDFWRGGVRREFRTEADSLHDEAQDHSLQATNAEIIVNRLERNAGREIDGRAAGQVYPGDETVLVFQPTGSQLNVGVSQSGRFTVEVTPVTIPTPIGTFSYRTDKAVGVKRLIIVSEGQHRYLKLDRPFSIFIPTEYGVEVSSTTPGTLVLEVRQRDTRAD